MGSETQLNQFPSAWLWFHEFSLGWDQALTIELSPDLWDEKEIFLTILSPLFHHHRRSFSRVCSCFPPRREMAFKGKGWDESITEWGKKAGKKRQFRMGNRGRVPICILGLDGKRKRNSPLCVLRKSSTKEGDLDGGKKRQTFAFSSIPVREFGRLMAPLLGDRGHTSLSSSCKNPLILPPLPSPPPSCA